MGQKRRRNYYGYLVAALMYRFNSNFYFLKNFWHIEVLCQISIVIRPFGAELWTDRQFVSFFFSNFRVLFCCMVRDIPSSWQQDWWDTGFSLSALGHAESILQLLTKLYWLIGATRSQESGLYVQVSPFIHLSLQVVMINFKKELISWVGANERRTVIS
jgi:hypothetical protein